MVDKADTTGWWKSLSAFVIYLVPNCILDIKFTFSLTCIFFELWMLGDIVNYLFQQYGKGRSPSTGLLERYGHQKLSQWSRILYFLWVQLSDLRWSYQLLVFSMSSYSYFEIINYTALRLETKLSINVIFHVFL